MDWRIAYKVKPRHGTLEDNLKEKGIECFIPIRLRECLDGDKVVEKKEEVFRNIVFLHTDDDVSLLSRTVDGLRCPYLNIITGKQAVVKDEEMSRFKKVLEMKNVHASFLPDAFRRFENCPKVRVRAGEFAGIEGHVFRIRGDRKVVIALDDMAVAISGIHQSLLEFV